MGIESLRYHLQIIGIMTARSQLEGHIDRNTARSMIRSASMRGKTQAERTELRNHGMKHYNARITSDRSM